MLKDSLGYGRGFAGEMGFFLGVVKTGVGFGGFLGDIIVDGDALISEGMVGRKGGWM